MLFRAEHCSHQAQRASTGLLKLHMTGCASCAKVDNINTIRRNINCRLCKVRRWERLLGASLETQGIEDLSIRQIKHPSPAAVFSKHAADAVAPAAWSLSTLCPALSALPCMSPLELSHCGYNHPQSVHTTDVSKLHLIVWPWREHLARCGLACQKQMQPQ